MSKRAYGQALRKGDEEIQLSELMWHELLRLGLSFAFGEDYLEHEEEDNHRDSTVIKVTSRLYTANGTYACAIGIHKLLKPLQISEIATQAMKYHIA